MFNFVCELSQPMGKTNFPAPLKIEQTLSHRKEIGVTVTAAAAFSTSFMGMVSYGNA